MSKGCGVRGVVAQRSAGIRAEQGGVNAQKGPIFGRRGEILRPGTHAARMAVKKAGSGKPPSACSERGKDRRPLPERLTRDLRPKPEKSMPHVAELVGVVLVLEDHGEDQTDQQRIAGKEKP